MKSIVEDDISRLNVKTDALGAAVNDQPQNNEWQSNVEKLKVRIDSAERREEVTINNAISSARDYIDQLMEKIDKRLLKLEDMSGEVCE